MTVRGLIRDLMRFEMDTPVVIETGTEFPVEARVALSVFPAQFVPATHTAYLDKNEFYENEADYRSLGYSEDDAYDTFVEGAWPSVLVALIEATPGD